jgi:hypothetical protein
MSALRNPSVLAERLGLVFSAFLVAILPIAFVVAVIEAL